MNFFSLLSSFVRCSQFTDTVKNSMLGWTNLRYCSSCNHMIVKSCSNIWCYISIGTLNVGSRFQNFINAATAGPKVGLTQHKTFNSVGLWVVRTTNSQLLALNPQVVCPSRSVIYEFIQLVETIWLLPSCIFAENFILVVDKAFCWPFMWITATITLSGYWSI